MNVFYFVIAFQTSSNQCILTNLFFLCYNNFIPYCSCVAIFKYFEKQLTEHLVQEESREFTTRAVRYVDMCRALRLGVSMTEDPKWNLPVGTIEMLESRNFALERLFIKFYQKAIDISFVNLKNEGEYFKRKRAMHSRIWKSNCSLTFLYPPPSFKPVALSLSRISFYI